MFGGCCRAVVVIARVARYNRWVRLPRQRTHYVRKRIVRQPTHTIVVGLARPHPVTGDVRVTFRATRALARIVPRRQQSARRADRQVRHPLRTSRGIGIQLERRAKGNAAVGRFEHQISVVVRKATSAFIHASDVDGPVARHVPSDLNVADKGGAVNNCYGAMPGGAVISGESDLESPLSYTEVVPGNI